MGVGSAGWVGFWIPSARQPKAEERERIRMNDGKREARSEERGARSDGASSGRGTLTPHLTFILDQENQSRQECL